MYLKDFNQVIKCCEFNEKKWTFDNIDYVREKKTTGFFSLSITSGAAVYPDNDKLVFAISGKKWDLLNEKLEVNYFHDYPNKETKFSIQGLGGKWSTTYRSWWADRTDFVINEMAASCEEENSEEDFLAYIEMLAENKDSSSSLFKLWSANLTLTTGL